MFLWVCLCASVFVCLCVLCGHCERRCAPAVRRLDFSLRALCVSCVRVRVQRKKLNALRRVEHYERRMALLRGKVGGMDDRCIAAFVIFNNEESALRCVHDYRCVAACEPRFLGDSSLSRLFAEFASSPLPIPSLVLWSCVRPHPGRCSLPITACPTLSQLFPQGRARAACASYLCWLSPLPPTHPPSLPPHPPSGARRGFWVGCCSPFRFDFGERTAWR
jgi:hypothetical protein